MHAVIRFDSLIDLPTSFFVPSSLLFIAWWQCDEVRGVLTATEVVSIHAYFRQSSICIQNCQNEENEEEDKEEEEEGEDGWIFI